MCEDAPCCGCCGPDGHEPVEFEGNDFDDLDCDDEPDVDELQENEDFAQDHLDYGEDSYLDGSYEME